MAGHTQGPWLVSGGNLGLDGDARFKTSAKVMVYADEDCEIHPVADCSCNHTCRMEDEQEANARLIAAAPCLLQTLEDLRDWLALLAIADADDVFRSAPDRFDEIQAVIAKATQP